MPAHWLRRARLSMTHKSDPAVGGHILFAKWIRYQGVHLWLRVVGWRTAVMNTRQDWSRCAEHYLDSCPGNRLLVIYFPEPVTKSRDRKDKFWSLGVFFQFLPQAEYVGIDGSGERISAITPHRP